MNCIPPLTDRISHVRRDTCNAVNTDEKSQLRTNRAGAGQSSIICSPSFTASSLIPHPRLQHLWSFFVAFCPVRGTSH